MYERIILRHRTFRQKRFYCSHIKGIISFQHSKLVVTKRHYVIQSHVTLNESKDIVSFVDLENDFRESPVLKSYSSFKFHVLRHVRNVIITFYVKD